MAPVSFQSLTPAQQALAVERLGPSAPYASEAQLNSVFGGPQPSVNPYQNQNSYPQAQQPATSGSSISIGYSKQTGGAGQTSALAFSLLSGSSAPAGQPASVWQAQRPQQNQYQTGSQPQQYITSRPVNPEANAGNGTVVGNGFNQLGNGVQDFGNSVGGAVGGNGIVGQVVAAPFNIVGGVLSTLGKGINSLFGSSTPTAANAPATTAKTPAASAPAEKYKAPSTAQASTDNAPTATNEKVQQGDQKIAEGTKKVTDAEQKGTKIQSDIDANQAEIDKSDSSIKTLGTTIESSEKELAGLTEGLNGLEKDLENAEDDDKPAIEDKIKTAKSNIEAKQAEVDKAKEQLTAEQTKNDSLKSKRDDELYAARDNNESLTVEGNNLITDGQLLKDQGQKELTASQPAKPKAKDNRTADASPTTDFSATA